MGDTDLLQPTATHHELLVTDEPGPAASGQPSERVPEPPAVALVEIAIPVYNEEEILESSVRRLRTYLDGSFPFSAAIVIVDNASTDGTWEIASRLCRQLDGVGSIHLDQKGKGRAIRAAWTASRSPVVAYMDVDLSTGLDGLLPLVAPLLSGHSQMAIGSRIAPGSRVLRGGKRELISRSYNLLLRGALGCNFSDAQCGFKAMRSDAAEPLLGLVEDEHWFFDTELLTQAQRHGFRIHEVPVDWIDDPDSRVNIGGAMKDDLRGVWRLAHQRHRIGRRIATADEERNGAFASHRALARYAGVGIISTLAYLALFLLLRDPVGIFAANVIAAAVTTFGNTLAHIALTFRPERPEGIRYAVVVGACSFAIGIGLTSATLGLAYTAGSTSPTAEGVAILAGIVAASSVRFVLLREWAFRRHTQSVRASSDRIVEGGNAPVQPSQAA